MVPRLSERRQALLFAAVLVVSIAALYAAAMAVQSPDVRPSVVRALGLRIEGADWTSSYRAAETTNNTPFSFLMEASVRLGFPVEYKSYEIPRGVLVLAINGSENGDGSRFWQYWVNDVYAELAADRVELHDGDSVLWRFVAPQEGP